MNVFVGRLDLQGDVGMFMNWFTIHVLHKQGVLLLHKYVYKLFISTMYLHILWHLHGNEVSTHICNIWTDGSEETDDHKIVKMTANTWQVVDTHDHNAANKTDPVTIWTNFQTLHIGRVYAVTRVRTLLTTVARKRRGLVPRVLIGSTQHGTWVYRVARWRLSKRKCYLFRCIL